ncbi:acetate--CoA ligase family protein [Paralcaligenes ginsengisoli]
MDTHTANRESIERNSLPAYFDRCRRLGLTALNEKAGKTLLAAFGLRVPRSLAVTDPDAAALACASLSPPYAVKVLSSQALHKSDLGGVRLGVQNADEVRAAACGIRDGWPVERQQPEGFLVEEMASPGHELVIGGYVDPQFGPMLMVGLGGVFVEIFSDVVFRVCPIDTREARAMLKELRALPILRGARAGMVASEEAIVDALVKVGGSTGILMTLADEIDELDINPLIVDTKTAVAVDVRITFTSERRRAGHGPRARPVDFGPLFAPQTIAVAGVSASGRGAGNRFIRNLEILGFEGEIYPMHPSLAEIDGRPVYRNFSDMPRQVDYAYIAVPRAAVPELLENARGKLQFAQIMTSGFGEGGRGSGSKHDLMEAIKIGGMRVLGPNCLGIYTPRGRVSFTETHKIENPVGHVGVISQSGGFGIDMLRYGQLRGLRFSGVVTIGNSIDLGPNDLLEYFLADDATHIIGLYLEDIQDGRLFFELLSKAGAKKPVVLLKGGRTSQGQKAAASHTGSLAGDIQVWQAVTTQTGCVPVNTMEELVDTLLLFQTIKPNFTRPTCNLALMGNGGGASVVASDGFAQLGFSLAEFSAETKERLHALNLPDGASDNNPIDVPANVFDRTEGRVASEILDALCSDSRTDAVVVHLNLPALLSYRGRRTVENIMDACIAHRQSKDGGTALAVILRSDGSPETDAARRLQRDRAAAAGVPVFENFAMAGCALRALAIYENFHFKKSQMEYEPRQ